MRKLVTPLTAVVATLLWLVPMATPAGAHAGTIYAWEADRGHGGWTTYHYYVYACDDRGDSLGVRLDYITRSGIKGNVGDDNGSQDGCGSRTLTDPVVKVRFCYGYDVCNPTSGNYFYIGDHG